MTTPKKFTAARTWMTILLIIVCICELSVSLGIRNIPLWLYTSHLIPLYLTEHELFLIIHLSFPSVMMTLLAVSDYVYKDECSEVQSIISILIQQQKVCIVKFMYMRLCIYTYPYTYYRLMKN